MKPLWGTVIISSIIHLIIMAAVINVVALSNYDKETVVIDFSASESFEKESPVKEKKQEASPSKPKKQVIPKSLPVDHSTFSDPDTVVKNETDSVNVTSDNSKNKDSDASNRDDSKIEAKVVATQNPEQILQQKREKYLKEQFEYIRNIIYRKASYPSIAIEMKLTGTVFLSFCVLENGNVESVNIEKSSGRSLLDNDAVATVIKAAPFPKPPVRVLVKFPFQYKLE